MLGPVNWYLLLLLFIFLRHRKWKSRAVGLWMCVFMCVSLNPNNEANYIVSYHTVGPKSWYLRGTDWSPSRLLDLDEQSQPEQDQGPSTREKPLFLCPLKGALTRLKVWEIWREPIFSGTSWEHLLKAMVPFSPHFPKREREIQYQAAGRALPLFSPIWVPGLVLSKSHACSRT